MAEITFEVTFGAPAELVVGSDGLSSAAEMLGFGFCAETVDGVVAPATSAGPVLAEGDVIGGVFAVATLGGAGGVDATAGEGAAVETGCSSFVAGAMLTFTAAGVAAALAGEGAALPPPVTLAIPSPPVAAPLAVFVSAAEVAVRGTTPVPGALIPGKTVPCCKLPTFG